MKTVSLWFVFCLLISSITFGQDPDRIVISTPEKEYSVERVPLAQSDEETKDFETAHANYNDMTDEERHLFEESRLNYMTKIAHVLNKRQTGFGLLVTSKEFVAKLKNALKAHKKIPDGELGIIVQRAMEEEEQRLRLNPEQKKSLQEKGQLYVGELLNKINRSLYQKSKLVLQSDEIGFSVGVGFGANAGVGKYVVGALADISFMFGFNRKTKTFTFEIQAIVERAKLALTPLLMATVDIRSGLYFKNSTDRTIQKGESLFTPAIPTAFSSYPSHIDSYVSTGIGFPPMATELMGYVSNSYRIPLIRIEISLDPKISVKVKLGFNPFKPKVPAKLKCAQLLSAI
ncbi:hypothetical protein K2P97_09895 [bacterium]|nr:hypothetical protein [bacterium]